MCMCACSCMFACNNLLVKSPKRIGRNAKRFLRLMCGPCERRHSSPKVADRSHVRLSNVVEVEGCPELSGMSFATYVEFQLPRFHPREEDQGKGRLHISIPAGLIIRVYPARPLQYCGLLFFFLFQCHACSLFRSGRNTSNGRTFQREFPVVRLKRPLVSHVIEWQT